MDRLLIYVVVQLGVVLGSADQISGSVVMTVSSGDNVTLYCDCTRFLDVYIVWYRNCSHQNQPPLVLKTKDHETFAELSRYEFVNNSSFKTYDLVISNVSDSDEGFYYCGTEKTKLEQTDRIRVTHLYTYGNVTSIIVGSRMPDPPATPQNCTICWMLLVSLCPVFALLSSLCFSLLLYHLCRKRGLQSDDQSSETGVQTRPDKDEDMCYAALEIRQPSQRPKRKAKSSDFSTYSAILYVKEPKDNKYRKE